MPSGPTNKQVTCPRCGTVTPIPAASSRSPTTPPAAPPGSSTTQRLGQYRLVRKIGEGGFGAVYEGIQDQLERRVAVKVLPQSRTANQAYVERFQREAKLAASLNHPGLVGVYDIGFERGWHYYAMEFIDGETLGQRIVREGNIPADQALPIAKSVLQALDYAWNQGRIVHRDVKPDNIMITRDGQVKLADLGLSKSIAEDSDLTKDNAGLGTAAYVAPEQGRGAKSVDCRADLYSLGITLFHALTGQKPFVGDTPLATLMAHVEKPLPDPRSINPDVPPAVCRFIEKMCAKNPANRFQTHRDALEEMEKLVHSLEAFPRSSGAAGSLKASTRVPRLAAVKHISSPDRTETARGGKKKRRRMPVPLFIGLASMVIIGLGIAALFGGFGRTPAAPQSAVQAQTDAAKTAYEEAVRFASDHPGDFAQAIEMFQKIEAAASQSEFGPKARTEREKVEKAWQEVALEAWSRVESEVQAHAAAGRFREGLAAIDQFPKALSPALPDDKAPALVADLEGRASRRFDEILQQAESLVGDKKFDEARQLYVQAQAFGFPALATRAGEKLEELGRVERDQAAALKDEQQKKLEEAYQKNREEVRALASEGDLNAALGKCDELLASHQFEGLGTRIEAERGDLLKARSVFEEAAKVLEGRIGKEITVRALKGTLKEVRGLDFILQKGDEEASISVTAMPAAEVAILAGPGLLTRGAGERSLCLALFWSYVGKPERAAREFNRAKDAGIDVTPYAEKMAAAQQAQANTEEQVEAEKDVSEAERKKRKKLLDLLDAVEDELVQKSQNAWNAHISDIKARYENFHLRPWKAFADANPTAATGSSPQKTAFIRAREQFDSDIFAARKSKKDEYEGIHGNALRLKWNIKSGNQVKGLSLESPDSNAIRRILTGPRIP